MKKLQKYKKIVQKLDNLSDLGRFGFKVKYVESVCGKIYINKAKKVVIKANYLCNDRAKSPKHAIPTVSVHNRHISQGKILIQPLADVSYRSVKRARKLFMNRLPYSVYMHLYDHFDFHDGNIAMYNRKPVIIDW